MPLIGPTVRPDLDRRFATQVDDGDTMRAAFDKAATPGFQARAESTLADEGHNDKVLMILHYAPEPASD